MISGIFDEYLFEEVARRKINVSPEVMRYAGISTMRALNKVYQECNYEAKIISAGTRQAFNWVELAGPGQTITLSSKIAEMLVQENPPLVNRIQESAHLKYHKRYS